MKQAASTSAHEAGDDAWHYLPTHDLRRSWPTALFDNEVNAVIALEWCAWEDLETFLGYYKGAYSPAALRRARDKVEWL